MTLKEQTVTAVISVQASLTSHQILDAVRQLDAEELEHVMWETMRLSAQRKSAVQFQRESELLEIIFSRKSVAFCRRFNRLNARRHREQLSQEEHAELLQLIDTVQAADVRYIEALSELANLRDVVLPELMKQLGIESKP